MDKIILVKARDEIRIERVLKRDKQRKKHEIMNIINSQKLQNIEGLNPDFILENNGDDLLLPKVIKIIEEIKLKV